MFWDVRECVGWLGCFLFALGVDDGCLSVGWVGGFGEVVCFGFVGLGGFIWWVLLFCLVGGLGLDLGFGVVMCWV